jgi:hypothetical protein
MYIKKNILILISLITIASCDPGASVEYRIINLSNKDAIIELKKDVAYTVHYKDSIICYYSTDDSSVILRNNEFIRVYYEWMNNRVESYRPLWEEIESIIIEDSIVSPQYWSNAELWKKSRDKGIYWETIKYDLFLKGLEDF